MAETGSGRHAIDRLLADLRGIFGARLRSFGTYDRRDSSATSPVAGDEVVYTVALVDGMTFEDLSRCARASDSWMRSGLAVPLVLPRNEFSHSLDAFPLEYSQIQSTYAGVHGDSPFDDVQIALEDRRRACEMQAKSHLLHLREGYIETGGRGPAVARLLAYSVAAFRALLTNVARLQGGRADNLETVLAHAESMGLSRALIAEIFAIRPEGGLAAADAGRLFPQYLDAVERIARLVDRWRA